MSYFGPRTGNLDEQKKGSGPGLMVADFFKSDQDMHEQDVSNNQNNGDVNDELASDVAPVPSFGKRSADQDEKPSKLT